MFIIGATLGSIIRKGARFTTYFAIAFFVLFNMLNTFGEKFAKQGVTKRIHWYVAFFHCAHANRHIPYIQGYERFATLQQRILLPSY